MLYLLFNQLLRYQMLVAGSTGWSNYRHQADVMALSTLFHTDSSNTVITMIPDDVVNHYSNPYPNSLFNTLNTSPSYNVYHPEFITSRNITLEEMKHQLSKYSFSPNDIITLYYNNHGAPGYLCTPNGMFDGFFADDIESYLKELSSTGAKILFIIESCYSGSVAKYISLPNVLTISASNSIQSSYAAKYSEELGTFTTNLFTLNLINYLNNNENEDKTILDLVNYLCAYYF